MGKSQPSKQVLELSDSESDEEVGIKSKPKQTQNILKNWNELTIMSMNLNVSMVIQYRIWPETIDAGRHDSLENPPKGLSSNLNDGREILELVHPLHHLPVVQVLQSKQH